MFKEIGRVTELLKYPQNKILDLDKVAHINGEGLTLTIATEECAELIQAITKLKRYGFYDRYKNDLHEEVADVLICITELVALGYLDIDKVREWQKFKINREVEIAIRRLGRECGFENIHPHRFRRTAATTALRKGMPIEQVQLMLGHEQIDTTMIYAKTDTKNVKYSHDKYM